MDRIGHHRRKRRRTGGDARLEPRFSTLLQNSDEFTLGYRNTYELLLQPFGIAPGVAVPPGSYDFGNASIGFKFGRQRRLSGNVAVDRGTFYGGHKTAITLAQGAVKLSPQLSIEPTYSVNWIDLPAGSFTTQLLGSRLIYTITPQMFVTALLQYNSSSRAVTANVRLRWEYRRGSELFVVFNEQRDTLGRRFPDLANRAPIVKLNRLWRL